MFDYMTTNNLIQLIQIIADIGCVWVVIYYCLKIVKNNSRTIQIFKGILLVVLIKGVATLFGLSTVEYLADIFVNWGILAFIIIFQPEIRSLLEKLGKTSVFSRISTLTVNEREKLVDELVKACSEMSKNKTGALISLEQGHSLTDFIKTGTPMNSVVTSELLCSIFVPGTPLHDGAVILQGVKIACAAAYFPPTSIDLPTSYGARHRAAVGISEITDSITIVVSEETGNISIAEGGKLTVVNDKSLREFLLMVICQTENEVAQEKISKESDMEKDILQIEEDRAAQEAKTSKFSAYLKNRSKRNKEKGIKPKKIEIEEKEKKRKLEKKKLEIQVEKIGIENLVEENQELDSLFDTIVSESDTKPSNSKEYEKMDTKEVVKVEKQDVLVKTPVKKHHEARNPVVYDEKEESAKVEKKQVVKRAHQISPSKEIVSLLDDVIDPDTIILNYKSSKATSSSKDEKEGSDEEWQDEKNRN